MYKCEDCGRVFDEPTTVNKIHNEFGVSIPEPVYLCPFCHSDDYGSIKIECSTCANWEPNTEYCAENDKYTDSCEKCGYWTGDWE